MKENAMPMVMKLCGVALLWAGLAALVYVPTAASGVSTAVVAGLGFLSFASGLMLFGDGLKREIAAQQRLGS
jgi:hypothetical protein